jgi:hypothetical protein
MGESLLSIGDDVSILCLRCLYGIVYIRSVLSSSLYIANLAKTFSNCGYLGPCGFGIDSDIASTPFSVAAVVTTAVMDCGYHGGSIWFCVRACDLPAKLQIDHLVTAYVALVENISRELSQLSATRQ